MKNTTTWFFVVPFFVLFLIHSSVSAFPDFYEPDNNVEQAKPIHINNNENQQYTLHLKENSDKDEDWFKFIAREGIQYDIIVEQVGADIDVAIELYHSDGTTLLEQMDDKLEGVKELFSWRASSEGVYYLKISDVSQSDGCRANIQYELRLLNPEAGTAPGAVEGIITDIAGNPISDAIIRLNCDGSDADITDETGQFQINLNETTCPMGLYELNAAAIGYRFLGCQIPTIQVDDIHRHLFLVPDNQPIPPLSPIQLTFRNGDTLRPSQPIYHNGDTLKVEFELHGLLAKICVRYHIGIAYPDGRFFIITQLNQFEALNLPSLPSWAGTGNVVIDKSVSNEMPRGEYLLYLLRMPEGIDPVENMDKGELNVGQFRIE